MPIEFLYRDADVVAVNKPEGVAAVPEHAHDPGCLSALVSAADFPQAHDSLVGDEFQNGAQKIARVNAGVVAQLAGEGNGDGAGAEIDDFHG